MKELDQKERLLVFQLLKSEKVCVAFSGGTDSTLLAYLAYKYLGDRAIAITIQTPYVAKWEIEEAKQLAKSIGIAHKIIELPIPDSIRDNPPNRCYLCKKEIFSRLVAAANNEGCSSIMDGSNGDDTLDYRPGLKALRELEIVSPMLLANITKEEVRQLSRKYGLATSEKPAYACLLTRIPHNHSILTEELERVERAEVVLHERGYKSVRVRSHDSVARLELPYKEIKRFMQNEHIPQISKEIKQLGYKYVAIDLEGYAIGNMNEEKKYEQEV